jgi:hypothetical protein
MISRSKLSRGAKFAAGALGAAVVASAVVGVPAAFAQHNSPAPVTISSITVSGYPLPATPTVTVSGSGFGSAPAHGIAPSSLSNCGGSGTGLDYGPSTLWLLDASHSSGPGLLNSFQEGAYFTKKVGNCGGIDISSWTTTQVQFTLGSRYAAGPNSLTSGDDVCVEIKGVPGCIKLA